MQSLILLLVLALVTGVARLLQVGRRPRSYPPGPPTIPILGNIHQVTLISSQYLCRTKAYCV